MIEFPFVGRTSPGRSIAFNTERTINLFPIADEYGKATEGKPIPYGFEGTPGLKKVIDTGTEEESRGMIVFQGYLMTVVGSNLYRCTAGGDFSIVGGLSTNTGLVSMAQSGLELMIVDGVKGYVYNGTSTKDITDQDFVGLKSSDVIYIDSRFLVNEPGSGRIWKSDLLDAFTWTALGFTTAESKPDNLIKLLNDHNILVAFGEHGMEFYTNTGNTDFPFQPVRNLYQEYGCLAQRSVAQVDNTIIWIGQSINGGVSVYSLQKGPAPVRISTDAIDKLLSDSDVASAHAISILYQGHPWYVLTLGNRTIVYDATAQTWFEWAYTPSDRIPEDLRRHRMNCSAWFDNAYWVGDFENGKIYKLDGETRTDDGQHIRWMRQSPILHKKRSRIFLSSVQIDMEVGEGLVSGQGSDPKVILEISRDGGNSFQSKKYISQGKTGEKRKRIIARMLGSAYDFVVRLSGSEPITPRIIGAFADAEVEPE